MKQEMTGWHWHQLDHKQIICTLLQTDNHSSTSSFNFFIGRMLSKHWRQKSIYIKEYGTVLSPQWSLIGLTQDLNMKMVKV